MTIRYEKQGNIAIFTLDNPPVNTWTPQQHKDFYHHLRDFLQDDDIHVGILTGEGDRCFSAGDDIKTPRPKRTASEQVKLHLSESREDQPPEYPGWEREVLSMRRFKPIIGAVNGICVGQGMAYLMMLTDIRIAARHAQIGLPEIAWGMGGAGGAIRLSRFIPHSCAMYMLLTGEKLSAQRAYEYTILNEVVEKEDLMPRAMEIAQRIAKMPPTAVRVEMEASTRCMDMNREDALAFTDHLYRLQRLAADSSLPDFEKHLDRTSSPAQGNK